MKLELAGYELSHFRGGAFGDDHEDRNMLVPIAIERYRETYGVSFEPQETVVIGDTPRDIECARAAGAKAFVVQSKRRHLHKEIM